MTVTVTAVKDTLKILGRSRAEIAERLENKGVTGRVSQSNFCVIANYLRREFPEVINVDVDRDSIKLDDVCFVPTRQVSSFISWFDQEMYPNLITGGSDD